MVNIMPKAWKRMKRHRIVRHLTNGFAFASLGMYCGNSHCSKRGHQLTKYIFNSDVEIQGEIFILAPIYYWEYRCGGHIYGFRE